MSTKHLSKEFTSYGKILLFSTSSMTRLLEIYNDEEIKVEIIQQTDNYILPSILTPFVNDTKNTILREAYLYTRESLKTCLHAFSLLFVNNIEDCIQEELIQGEIPIGKIIEKYKLETYREILTISNLEHNNDSFLGIGENIIYKVSEIRYKMKPLFLVAELFREKDLVCFQSI
ncbi:chorismate pyruvate-lyase family protein [Bacillus cereus]|nr:chorismate pyruvate-lyase family protein [Bacillus cereus]MDA2079891.1 chorismate pyruvate-lyase family protein [Bacillus cereus]MDA2085481.1 chorismate pyruvate-lyase family protein [Bacillus cereus]MDA2178583.1 chorismate pyruvate-lyase family protein [Bacillus cereus]